MNKRDGYYVDNDTILIDNRRVRVAEFNTQAGKGIAPSYGYRKQVVMPWGAIEECIVVTVPSLSGGKDKYAQVYRPKSNPGVSFSTFRLTDI